MNLKTKHFAVVLSVVVLITQVGPAIANESDFLAQAIPQQTSLNEVDPLFWDAQIYATHMGISLEEAIRRFQIQNMAGNLETELSVKEADTFAGLWLEHAPKFQLVVQFMRNAEVTLEPYLPKELVDITQARTASVSLIDLQRSQEEAILSLKASGIIIESGIDVVENHVDVYVADRIRLNFALQRGSVRLPDNVKVITVKDMGRPQADIYGGLALSLCTSGFSVQDSEGRRGITTAAHCDNNLSYNGTNLVFQSQLYSGSYDIQWHTAPGFTVKNKIQAPSSGSTRDITSTVHRNNQVIGGYVCKFGSTTNYTCGYISDKNFCISYIQNCSPTSIRVDNTAGYNDLSSLGDSGGPWFLANAAYGTHSGSPGDDPNDAIYIAVNYIGGLGVSVMTAP